MEAGNKLWTLRKIVLRDGRNSSGYAWIHIPTETAFVVKNKEFGQTLTDTIQHVYDALPAIRSGDWYYAE
ncbi:MAG: hypothetical protein ACK5JL_07455 [Candidatus Kapaibacterium sp.]|jgi:translation elongation factor EF-Ts